MATPHAPTIELSDAQAAILLKISRQSTASSREVDRSTLILKIGTGLPNRRIAQELGGGLEKVRNWRKKWLDHQDEFQTIESDDSKKSKLSPRLREFLQDRPRPGTPSRYSSEEYCPILALALEPPEESGCPISEWTPRELADECKREEESSEHKDCAYGTDDNRFVESRVDDQPHAFLLLLPVRHVAG